MQFNRMTLTRQSGISRLFLIAVLIAMGMGTAFAQSSPPPKLSLPLQCVPGTDCWIFNYVDVDTRQAKRSDYACGRISYDKHRGVDFAIRDLAVMKQGVPVVASASGRVRALRDGMDDVGFTKQNRAEISKRGCGNAVILNHENGWQTRYCHMRKGSLSVKKGDLVSKGDQLGLVGMSGLAQFPHVHLEVRFKGKVIDPFVGIGGRQQCSAGSKPLWDKKIASLLPYAGAMLYNIGFASRRPLVSAVRAGTARRNTLPRNALKIFLFVDIRHARKGDVLDFKIVGPGNKAVAIAERKIKRNRALNLQVVDITSRGAWRPGIYRGEVGLTRTKKEGVKRFKTSTEVIIK